MRTPVVPTIIPGSSTYVEILKEGKYVVATFSYPNLPLDQAEISLMTDMIVLYRKKGSIRDLLAVPLPAPVVTDEYSVAYNNGVYDFTMMRAHT